MRRRRGHGVLVTLFAAMTAVLAVAAALAGDRHEQARLTRTTT